MGLVIAIYRTIFVFGYAVLAFQDQQISFALFYLFRQTVFVSAKWEGIPYLHAFYALSPFNAFQEFCSPVCERTSPASLFLLHPGIFRRQIPPDLLSISDAAV